TCAPGTISTDAAQYPCLASIDWTSATTPVTDSRTRITPTIKRGSRQPGERRRDASVGFSFMHFSSRSQSIRIYCDLLQHRTKALKYLFGLIVDSTAESSRFDIAPH